MKTIFKRNKIYKSKTTGRYSLKRLNKNERERLQFIRHDVSSRLDVRCEDDYITALYNDQTNEIYFISEMTFSNAERALVIYV